MRMKRSIYKPLILVILFAILLVALSGCNNTAPEEEPEVEEPKIVSVEIDKATIPSDVIVGTLRLTEIELIVKYDNDTEKRIELTEDYIALDSVNKLKKAGQHKINVNYKGFTTFFNITLKSTDSLRYTLHIEGGSIVSVNGEPYEGAAGDVVTETFVKGTIVYIEWNEVPDSEFVCWECNREVVDTQPRTRVVVDNNDTYIAKYKEIVYKVSFVTYHETIDIAAKEVKVLNESDINPMSMDGYVFLGWTDKYITNSQALSGEAVDLIEFPYAVTQDVTLYGVWKNIGLEYTSFEDSNSGKKGKQIIRYVGNLTDLVIPEKVESMPVLSIAADAFLGDNCRNIKRIYIPSSVVNIEEGAFRNCSSLQSFVVSDDNRRYSSESGVLYMNDKTAMIAYPASKVVANYEMESNVETIASYAFYNAVVGSIEVNSALLKIGNHAFDSVHIDNVDFSALEKRNLETLNAIGKYVFSDRLSYVFVKDATAKDAYSLLPEFSNISNKISYDEEQKSDIFVYQLPKRESEFLLYRLITGTYFENTNRTAEIIGVSRCVESVEFGDSISTLTGNSYTITSIGYYAFKDCVYLTNVVLPGKLERVCDMAFFDTPWVKTLANESIVANNTLYKYLGSGTNYDLDANIVKIAEGAFSNNENLVSVNMSSNILLEKISAYAFYNCASFKAFNTLYESGNESTYSVYIRNGVKIIGNYAFAKTAIRYINSQSEDGLLSSVEDMAFADCYYLKEANFKQNGLTNIGNRAFRNDYSLEDITVSSFNDKYVSYGGILYGKTDNVAYSLVTYPSGKLYVKEFNPMCPQTGVVLSDLRKIEDYALCDANIAALLLDRQIVEIGKNALSLHGLIYVRFNGNPNTSSISYVGAFTDATPEYFVFDDYDNVNLNTFFGVRRDLINLATNTVPCEFVEENGVLYAVYNESNVVKVCASDRKTVELSVAETVTLNGKVYNQKAIGAYAFGGYYLRGVTISDNTLKIEAKAFNLAQRIEYVSIATENVNNVPSISKTSFGPRFDNGLLIKVNIDPETDDSYFDVWAGIIHEETYSDLDKTIKRFNRYLIYKYPYVVLTNNNDEGVPVTIAVLRGDTIKESDLNNLSVKNEGYDIGGWDDENGNAVDLKAGYALSHNLILNCKWVAQKYELYITLGKDVTPSFKCEKVSETENEVVYKIEMVFGSDYSLDVLDSNTKKYVIKGWLVSAGEGNGEKLIPLAGTWDTPADNGRMYLKLSREKREYQIQYDLQYVDSIENARKTVYFDEDFTLDIPVRKGYVFLGWSMAENDENSLITYDNGLSRHPWTRYSDTQIFTVYPVWQAKEVTVTLMLDKNVSYGTLTIRFTQSDYLIPLIKDSITNDEYLKQFEFFAGWRDEAGVIYTNSEGRALRVWDKTEDCVMYAVWPTKITSLDDLKNALNNDMNASLLLETDLAVSETVGVLGKAYTGVFNGNGHTITLSRNAALNNGFSFGMFAKNSGTIKNVNVIINSNVTLQNGNVVGSFGALCDENSGIIEGVKITVEKFGIILDGYSDKVDNALRIGAVFGLNNGSLSDCNIIVKEFFVKNDGMPYVGNAAIGVAIGENGLISQVSGKIEYHGYVYEYYVESTEEATAAKDNWGEVYGNYYYKDIDGEMKVANVDFDENATYYKYIIDENDRYRNKNMVCGINKGNIDDLVVVFPSK